MDGDISMGGMGRRKEALAANPAEDAYTFDAYDVPGFVRVARDFGESRYGYVVTPNVDHLVRLRQEPRFAYAYNVASFVLLDSRLLARLLRWRRNIEIPTCPGSDLTEQLFKNVVRADDRIVLIGGSLSQARKLAGIYGLQRLAHFNPPMGFIKDSAAIEQCLQFIEAHSPFRFCLLAVGSPQQEFLAQALRSRAHARGLALCVGASINFLTGGEKRAPALMQRWGLEWLYRVSQSPGRLFMRYVRAVPGLLHLLRHARFGLRAPAAEHSGMVILSRKESGGPSHRNGNGHQASPGQTG